MREQPLSERLNNFAEVPRGYSETEAVREAARCLQCRKKPCVAGCPVSVDIPAFIKSIAEGNFLEAARIIYRTNSLPCVTGRVCPQEDQCQKTCVAGKRGDPISIGQLERFAADWLLEERKKNLQTAADRKQKEKNRPGRIKVAMVGSGPASLTCASELAKKGFAVTVFEGFHQPGGVLVYGIPEFRLPKAIVAAETEYLKDLGVQFALNVLVGRAVTLEELFKDGYRAVFIGAGAGLPKFMDIPGENLAGIYSANEYLTRVNLMKAYLFPEYDTPVKKAEKVAVIGGGNVAMDAARNALRLKSKKVYLVYRRTEQEMPARREEVIRAKEEGVEFLLLTAPVRYLGDQDGFVNQMECIRMELGEPDASGRRRPVPIPGSNFMLNVRQVIVAVGSTPNPIIARTTPGLKTTDRGTIAVDENGRTSIPGVYAGGDIVTGAATVITAMGAGRTAAAAIIRDLQSNVRASSR